MAGMMAKYLATSLAMEKVVEHTAGHEQLLADLHDFRQLGRIGVEIDHVAGFFGRLRSRVHGHADIGLRQSRGIIGPIAGHGDELALGLFFLDEPHLCFRRGFGEEIIDAGFPRDRRRGARVVAGNHHRADTHGAETLKALVDAALDHVLEVNNAENLISFGDHQRRASGIGDPVGNALDLRADRAAQLVTYATIASTAPLRILRPSRSQPLIRVSALKGIKWAPISVTSRPRSPYLSLASTTIERPSGVSSARLANCAASASLSAHATDGNEFGRHAVAERDRAGLVEQQGIDVARRFYGAAAHGQHVLAQQTIHAGNADGGEQSANSRRNQDKPAARRSRWRRP